MIVAMDKSSRSDPGGSDSPGVSPGQPTTPYSALGNQVTMAGPARESEESHVITSGQTAGEAAGRGGLDTHRAVRASG